MKITRKILIILVAACLVIGCSDRSGIKAGYLSYSLHNAESMARLETSLKNKNIIYYKYTDEDKEYIAYPVKFESEVDSLVDTILGTHILFKYKPYKNTRNLCSPSERRKKEEAKILADNNVIHTTKSSIEDGKPMFCIYWPEEVDQKVKNLLPIFKVMKESCEHDPTCKK